MPDPSKSPVRRRLDLKAFKPAGGGPEYLTAMLVDESDPDAARPIRFEPWAI